MGRLRFFRFMLRFSFKQPLLFHEFGIHSSDMHAAWVSTGRQHIEANQESHQNAYQILHTSKQLPTQEH